MQKKLFFSALAKGRDWKAGVKEIAARVKKDLGGEPCDLAVVFVSEAYDSFDPAAFVRLLTDSVPFRVLVGCNSSGVIAGRTEVEMEPAISFMGMRLPGVKLYPFQLTAEQTDLLKNGADLVRQLDVYPPDKPHFICLADPMTADVTRLLGAFNDGYKGLPVVGGLASGGVLGASNWLCLNGRVVNEGAVGVALIGDIEFETIVSQGCRPVGKPYVITRAEGNVLYELAGRPALHVVRELLEYLTPRDRTLAEHSLSVGVAMHEQVNEFKRGDFLIRNIMGFDPDTGSLMIGAHLKVGQTLQFQLRDAETSTEDLRVMLEKSGAHENGSSDQAARGALLVSCCGRGRNFYGHADHDVQAIQTARGPLPLAGFFANGEFGPVGLKNYVHGYTSSLVILK